MEDDIFEFIEINLDEKDPRRKRKGISPKPKPEDIENSPAAASASVSQPVSASDDASDTSANDDPVDDIVNEIAENIAKDIETEIVKAELEEEFIEENIEESIEESYEEEAEEDFETSDDYEDEASDEELDDDTSDDDEFDFEEFDDEKFDDEELDDEELDDEEFDDEDSDDDDAPAGSIKLIKSILSYVLVIAIAFVAAVIIQNFVLLNATVPTGSMSPNIPVDCRLIGTRLSYISSSPSRGDVVIFKYPDDESQLYVKRVIGLPGDTITILDGVVYVNNVALDESAYLKNPETGDYYNGAPAGTAGPYTVPAGHYFMMGDNRNSSWDSRYWSHTYVSEDQIIAKASFTIYPKMKKIK